MRRTIMLILGLLSGLIWYVVQAGGGDYEGLSSSSVVGERERGPTRVDSTVPDQDVESRSAAPVDAAAGLAIPSATWRPIVCVFGPDGRPRAGVEVAIQTSEAWCRHGSFVRREGQAGEIRVTTDDEGFACLSGLAPGSWWAFAGESSLAGWTAVHQPEPGTDAEARCIKREAEGHFSRIDLKPARRYEIGVRDAGDRPVARAIVAIHDADAMCMDADYGSEFEGDRLVHGLTDTDGRIVFTVIPEPGSSLVRADRIKVLVPRFGVELVTETFEATDDGAVGLVRLPPTASLHLSARDANGMLPAGTTVLWLAGHESPTGGDWFSCGGSSVPLAVMAPDWLASWRVNLPPEGVSLTAFAPGATLAALVRAPGHLDATERIVLSHALQQRHVLSVGVRTASLQFLPVDDEGKTLVGVRVSEVWPDGREVPVAYSLAGDGASYLVFVAPDVSHRYCLRVRDSSESALLECPPVASGFTRDVGRVRVPLPPLLLAGRVVDGLGNPLGGVRVTVIGEAKGRRYRFQVHSGLSLPDGSFVINAEAREGLSYSCSAGGAHVSPRIPIQPGVRDLVIETTACGVIAGSIRPLPPELQEQMAINYRRSDDKVTERRARQAPGGGFEIAGLLPDRYRVEVRIAGMLVVSLENLVVSSGETLRPERLQDLDLSGQFEEVEIRMAGPEGEALVGADVEAIDPDQAFERGINGRRVETDARGIARLVVRKHEPIRIRCSTMPDLQPDFLPLREQIFTNPEFPLTVTMRPVPVLRCQLSRPLPVHSEGPWNIALTRRRTPDEIERITAARARLGRPTPARPPSSRVYVAHAKRLSNASLIEIPVESGEPGTWDLEVFAPGSRGQDESLILTKVSGPLEGDISLTIDITDEVLSRLAALSDSR
ncbi:MAG: carboxypeptidase regulatory-like domain-containing protein [Planctomycetes bacterium]|nr:carboxypeptidase regulatory-like domain-containing protein [Planctomycetota bacterium]